MGAILAGVLITSNPGLINDGKTVTFAATSTSLEKSKSKTLKNIKKVYTKYNKKNYSQEEYSKLTIYYNSAVEAIYSCETRDELKEKYSES